MKWGILAALMLMVWVPVFGQSRTPSRNYRVDISRGTNITRDTGLVAKFGYNPDIDATEQVWDGDSVYVFRTQANADTLYASSSVVADTVVVEISGLDSNYVAVRDTFTTQGRTQVAVPGNGTKWLRVFRGKVISVGGDGLPATGAAGDIYLTYHTATTNGVPDVDEHIQMKITAGENQTLMAIYTVPLGKVAVMVDWYVTTTSSALEFIGRIKATNGSDGIFKTKELVNLKGSPYARILGAPVTFPEKTDIYLQATAAAPNTPVAGGFSLILFDEDRDQTDGPTFLYRING